MHNDITTIIQDLFVSLGYEKPEVVVASEDEVGLVLYKLTVEDPGLLIGRNGEGIKALNHVIRAVAEQKLKLDQATNFTVDINQYYEKHIEELKTRARIVAERTKSFKRDMELNPMSSYDRLLVHAYLGTIDGITTESTGEGFERRIVVKYSGE